MNTKETFKCNNMNIIMIIGHKSYVDIAYDMVYLEWLSKTASNIKQFRNNHLRFKLRPLHVLNKIAFVRFYLHEFLPQVCLYNHIFH